MFHTRLEDDCLRQPQIALIYAEVMTAHNASQSGVPGEAAMSDHANSCDPDELASMEERVDSVCGSFGRSKCRDNILQRKTMVKAFCCGIPSQVSFQRPFEFITYNSLTSATVLSSVSCGGRSTSMILSVWTTACLKSESSQPRNSS